MSIIPCNKNEELRRRIEAYAETLRGEAHKLGTHGLDESEFYNSGLFRGAIERIRGQFSATMREKREFVKHILNVMEDRKFIANWESAGDGNRHDCAVRLNRGKRSIIELKGCLDGNNTNIFERPAQAQEFTMWSVCANPGADPRHNAWSGIHTRLSAVIISRAQLADGVIIWDMVCGAIGRPCPKVEYVFPATIPHPRNNPTPTAQPLQNVGFLQALHTCFQGRDDEVNFVDFEVGYRGTDTVRKTRIRRAGIIQRESQATGIRRG